jgi:ABC-type branched-subunit amino acid transport system ATPase component
LAEVIGLEAKFSLEKEEVKQTGTLAKGYKLTGIEGKGTVKYNHISSYFIELIGDNLMKGKSTVVDIISDLADPDSGGASERIKLTGCTFDDLTLADWEAKKLDERSASFTFTGFELLDAIPA